MFSGSHFEVKKQINVQGELLEATVSVVASREFTQRNPSACLPHFFLSASPLSDSLSCVVFHPLSFSISLFISQQLTVLFMCLSVLLNQSLAILSNANTLLSLDGYPPSDCWKMKHGSFSHLPDLQAKKFFRW